MDRSVSWGRALVAVLTLLAASGPAQAAPRTPPKGSYQASCSTINLSNAGMLTAACRDTNDHLQPTKLSMPTCGNGDVANTNGRLTCPPIFVAKKKPAPRQLLRPAVPVGPGSITLYDDVDYKGVAIEITADTPNLALTNFNDKVSSVKVHGGQWQLCVDWQYRGECSIIDRDAPNLSRFSLNNRVSSIRRVR
jgi:hypothetical protein